MIVRVFPRGTNMTPRDDYAFVGDPPMMRPEAEEVHISTVFTWDKLEAERLKLAWGQYYQSVKIGGPAYDSTCGDFIPGRYIRDGVVFTSRGCNNQCPWCLVWKREGKFSELPITEGNIIQDNNLLQCSHSHRDRVFAMLRGQKRIEFSGGLDKHLITGVIAEELRGLRIYQVFLACDTKESIKELRKAIKTLGLPRDKIRCYVLLKYKSGETLSDATERMTEVWKAGAMPFAQLYQPEARLIDYPKEWARFARAWSRPAIMRSIMKGDSDER